MKRSRIALGGTGAKLSREAAEPRVNIAESVGIKGADSLSLSLSLSLTTLLGPYNMRHPALVAGA
jgi:hypothetical protein